MYDQRATGAGNAIAAANNANLSPKMPKISENLLGDLSNLNDKALTIESRLFGLKERIFGSTPSDPNTNGIKNGVSNGFMFECQNKTDQLHMTFDRIFALVNDLERIA